MARWIALFVVVCSLLVSGLVGCKGKKQGFGKGEAAEPPPPPAPSGAPTS